MAYLGSIPNSKQQKVSALTGMNLDVNNTVFPLQRGVPQKTLYTYEFVPSSNSQDCIAETVVPTGAGFLTLQGGGSYTGQGIADISATVGIYNGVHTVFFDIEQCPGIWTHGGNLTTNDVTVIITGIDYRGAPVTASKFIASGSTTNEFYPTTTPMLGIQSVYLTNALGAGGSIGIGNSALYGLPYYLPSVSDVVAAGGRNVKTNAGSVKTFQNIIDHIVPGNNWRNSAPSSTTAARGYIDVRNLALEGNGDIAIALTYYIQGSDSELRNMLNNSNFNSTTTNKNVCLNSLALLGSKLTNSGTKYAYTDVLKQDLYGLQYASSSESSIASVSKTAADSIFYTNYATYLASY